VNRTRLKLGLILYLTGPLIALLALGVFGWIVTS
jgi:hypothetical protein